jgi:hypothetical protein
MELKPRTHDEEKRERAKIHSHSFVSEHIRTVMLGKSYSPPIYTKQHGFSAVSLILVSEVNRF